MRFGSKMLDAASFLLGKILWRLLVVLIGWWRTSPHVSANSSGLASRKQDWKGPQDAERVIPDWSKFQT